MSRIPRYDVLSDYGYPLSAVASNAVFTPGDISNGAKPAEPPVIQEFDHC